MLSNASIYNISQRILRKYLPINLVTLNELAERTTGPSTRKMESSGNNEHTDIDIRRRVPSGQGLGLQPTGFALSDVFLMHKYQSTIPCQ